MDPEVAVPAVSAGCERLLPVHCNYRVHALFPQEVAEQSDTLCAGTDLDRIEGFLDQLIGCRYLSSSLD